MYRSGGPKRNTRNGRQERRPKHFPTPILCFLPDFNRILRQIFIDICINVKDSELCPDTKLPISSEFRF